MSKKIIQILLNIVKVLALPVAFYLIFLILAKIFSGGQFGSLNSILTICQQAMRNCCIAMAMACNMLNNRWDFSIGFMVVATEIICANIVNALGLGLIPMLIVFILVGLAFGMVNATAYMLLKVPSIVTSVGLMMIYESLTYIVNGGLGGSISGNLLLFGSSPWVYIIGVFAMLVFYLLFTKRKFGYHVRALGGAQLIANNVGIKERKNVIGCYLLCGFMVAIAAIMNLSATGKIVADSTFNNAMGLMFEAFAPVFIGRYLSKYTNLAIGIFVGSFTIRIINTGLLSLGLPAAMQNVGIGLFLLAFIAITTNQGNLDRWRYNRSVLMERQKLNKE